MAEYQAVCQACTFGLLHAQRREPTKAPDSQTIRVPQLQHPQYSTAENSLRSNEESDFEGPVDLAGRIRAKHIGYQHYPVKLINNYKQQQQNPKTVNLAYFLSTVSKEEDEDGSSTRTKSAYPSAGERQVGSSYVQCASRVETPKKACSNKTR